MAAVVVCSVLPAQHTSTASPEITFDAVRLLSAEETYGIPVYEENDGKKHYLVALSGAALWVGTVLFWDYYLIGASWAKVDWDWISHFYEHKLEWDYDWYWTNFVLHPAQGAMSYMAGRSANLNRIESFALATLADFTWEYFCEKTLPSKNDLIYSSIGAFPVGEMLYRLSLEAGEIHRALGYLVNPERMWSELLLRQRPRGTVGNIYEMSVGMNMGMAYMHSSFGSATVGETFPMIASPWLSIVYNDPYGHDSNNPYNQFNLDIIVGLGVGSGRGMTEINENLFHDVRIMSDGMLISRARQDDTTDTTFGLVLEYDFIWNNMWQLSSLASGLAVKQRVRQEKSDMEWQVHLTGIMLGTTDWARMYRNFYYDEDMMLREYSYTVGAETVLRWKWRHTSGHTLAVDVHGYFMYDFAGQKQSFTDTGWECIALGTVSYELPLSLRVRLGVRDEIYIKKTFYPNIDNVFQIANFPSVYAKLQLK